MDADRLDRRWRRWTNSRKEACEVDVEGASSWQVKVLACGQFGDGRSGVKCVISSPTRSQAVQREGKFTEHARRAMSNALVTRVRGGGEVESLRYNRKVWNGEHSV